MAQGALAHSHAQIAVADFVMGGMEHTTATTQTEFKEVEALGAYVRAKTTLGGGTKPNHTAKVIVACTHPFTLQAA